MGEVFSIGDKEMSVLRRCEGMSFLIDHLGEIEEREVVRDPFRGMVYNIIYQQVSFASGNAIWKRWEALYGDSGPEEIAEAEEEELRACGLSRSKASYVQNLARRSLADRRLRSREALEIMSDIEIHDLYIDIKGIGPWSVKMFLIFTMERRNIRSYGDLALRRGVEWLHGEENISEERYMELTERYSPYNTAAAFYFWEITLQKLMKRAPDLRSYIDLMKRENINVK